ncbi:efflux RND transporter permease subunit [Parahaliea sp. F7430]|uniref:Efflux RND transporter permease subunit n=1 Tax=Sediminihaliea albiluteola TaxID=2758564 RepID=A0A7W2YJL8_9GAMM|nr:efflux RND transporter permease subunit [Sediminihaliea albiluteola]MBA6413255.1 efflux RND transporter permease subunit [Sediminihaliea albiluteola]
MQRGVVSWFIRNPIAANLLMVFLIIGGLWSVPALDKQFFPEFELNQVSVTLAYPGAGPQEVEEQICLRIEEAVHDITGVKEIRSVAREGLGTVLVKAEVGYDMQRLTAEIKTRIDAINTFPVDAERPVVTELAFRHHMATVTLSGDIGERNLKTLGERLRDDLASEPNVSVVELDTPRAYEVSVEISEYNLRRFGLSFQDVTAAIRASSLNLPAGAIKDAGGDIRLQTRGQAYTRADFARIPLLTTREGTVVLLGDVATIIDGFQDSDIRNRFNNKPSLNLHVYVTANPDTLSTSETVKAWLDEMRPSLPAGVELAMWRDSAEPFKGRVDTLLSNGLSGLALVFLVLVLFLRPMLALWVSIGILVAFTGTLFILQYTGTSLNMISLFAFLLVLGIVVDDAIIVGESIYSRQMAGEGGTPGALSGAQGVIKPVMFAVISTMIFFVPMFFMPGDMAQVAFAIPVVVIIALALSLLECLLILPSHLAHMRPIRPSRFAVLRKLERLRLACADGMTRFSSERYRPLLARCLNNNVLVSAGFFCLLMISLAIYGGGWVRAGFFPSVNSDHVVAEVTMPEGSAFSVTLAALEQVESAALKVKEEYNNDPAFAAGSVAIGHIDSRAKDNKLRVVLETVSDDVDTADVALRWRKAIGDLGPVEDFKLDYTINEVGKPIRLVLAAAELQALTTVSAELRQLLENYPGVYNINDSLQAPRQEIVLALKPAAENLSVTLADLARQVREAFYGAEVQRIPRAKEDVRVMVRYPEEERISVANLEDMRVRTPGGAEVPFATVAEIRYQPSYMTIERLNRKRTLEVSADVLPGTSAPRAVVNDIIRVHLPQWQQRYPTLSLALDGELQEESAFLSAMIKYLALALLVIYALMAIPFRSYFQPLLVLTAVPFGIMGAIFGHLLLNWQVSMFSLLGVIACAGVVVNDNLVLIDRINQLRDTGSSTLEALLQGGEDRFRPIILTSLTTFVGLLPIMSETSVQAQFLIPMVTSLAFGVLFATGVTLLLVPCLYLMGEQLAQLLARWRLALLGPA